MASNAPTWADQWGEGGIGVIDEDPKEESSSNNNNSKKKSLGLGKAKAAAIKWVKNLSVKKDNNPPPK
ncbi:hypothetical protein vseg_011544 [Gypsophila vaccaria]